MGVGAEMQIKWLFVCVCVSECVLHCLRRWVIGDWRERVHRVSAAERATLAGWGVQSVMDAWLVSH